MRVDTAPAAAGDLDLDHVTRLKAIIGAFRRSWYLLLAGAVVGAALGWVSTPEPPTPTAPGEPVASGPRYVRASHTLLVDQIGREATAGVDLTQAAYLALTGAVPQAVADKLDLPIDEVEGYVQGIARTDVSGIEIRAIGTDPDRVALLADTTAEVLLTYLEEQAQLNFEAERDEVVLELDRLDGQLTDLAGQIAGNPPNQAQLEAQYQSIANQYRLEYERFTQLADQGDAQVDLRSMGPSKAIVITSDEYDSSRRQIRDGLPTTSNTVPADQEAALPEEAAPPEAGASAPMRAATGSVAGLGLAVGLILLLDRFDTRLRTRDQTEIATGLTVVAEIPSLTRQAVRDLEVVAHAHPRARTAEAYRVIRGALLFHAAADDPTQVRHDGQGLTVLVTSANPAEGKTTTVANLAAVLAEGGLSVLVVNCDFRRPRVHKYLADDHPEAAETIANTAHGPVRLVPTRIPGVRLVTGLGEDLPDANPLEVVALQRRIIAMARPRFDVILLDTAPFLTTNDASELLPETDHVLLVVRAGKTRRLDARRMAEILDRFEAPVMGVVLNDSNDTPAAQYYYSYYLDASAKKERGSREASPVGGPTSAATTKVPGTTPATSGPEGAAPTITELSTSPAPHT